MFRQKTVIFFALAVIMAMVIACGSAAEPTAVPPTATPVPTTTPVPTATPVPVAPIDIDPLKDPVGFFNSLPTAEATCATDALDGRDRVLAMLESELETAKLTAAEAEAIDNCLSNETVQAVFVGQLATEAGTLSDATVSCIAEQTRGMSAAGLFVEQPAADSIISSLKGVFCLNHEERAALSDSDAMYGFGEIGGIDALECVVDGVGPTGLEELMGLASTDSMFFTAVGELFPLMIECGAIEDSTFNELGVSADQVGCVLSEVGEAGLALLDPTAAEPDLSELGSMLGALGNCGIELEDLLEGAALPIDTDASPEPVELPEVQIELPEELEDVELPFTNEQIICLTNELGEEQVTNLLEGGGADLSLFSALAICEVDIATLMGG